MYHSSDRVCYGSVPADLQLGTATTAPSFGRYLSLLTAT